MKFKVRCKEDISEVFEVYNVCRFRAQNKQGYDIRFLIYDGCFKYVTADVFEPAEESNDITDIIEYMKEIISEWENKDEVQSQM